jgi:hypothetical protein
MVTFPRQGALMWGKSLASSGDHNANHVFDTPTLSLDVMLRFIAIPSFLHDRVKPLKIRSIGWHRILLEGAVLGLRKVYVLLRRVALFIGKRR